MRILQSDVHNTVTHVETHVQGDGTLQMETKKKSKNSTSKNVISKRELRNDPAYRAKINERKRLRRKELKKTGGEEEEEAKVRRIPPRSILSGTTDNIEKNTGLSTKDCIARREVEIIEVTAFLHEKVVDEDKENKRKLVVYRSKIGALWQAWPSNS